MAMLVPVAPGPLAKPGSRQWQAKPAPNQALVHPPSYLACLIACQLPAQRAEEIIGWKKSQSKKLVINLMGIRMTALEMNDRV